ncbi:putative disease resistance RPP13-like protein 1 [Lactuca sativa]|uniref:NB-ARC domain-containing protein n=1 Tax=Lactuca sativa TaxID=4236 RepID=A0A9R1WLH6_LACSA|nr:putative disease resistance RPP13-like protein 1 [Lactuca sativa]KAJ0224922.1 hypothetical protein LSAT_V11C100038860 [Lactuca sativa]
MGGIEKTTLAKVLYNEQKVKDCFEVREWVCVSKECDVFNISKAIFHAVSWKNKDFANLDLLHVALKEEVSKKRFLLVLDDVWNEAPASRSYRKLKELHRAKHLQTFLIMSVSEEIDGFDKVLVELLPELQFLRVLTTKCHRLDSNVGYFHNQNINTEA